MRRGFYIGAIYGICAISAALILLLLPIYLLFPPGSRQG